MSRLIVNVAIAVVFAALYLIFLRRYTIYHVRDSPLRWSCHLTTGEP